MMATMSPAPRRHPTRADDGSQSILEVRDLVKHFPITGGLLQRQVGAVQAVDGVSLDLYEGETLGLVGESGCGKTTTGRTIARLLDPTSGTISYDGDDITTWSRRQLRSFRRDVQIVFQDPFSSLNPRANVHELIADPLRVHGLYRDGGPARIHQLLEQVGLLPEHEQRFPHEFSGGQRQRISIARALALQPRVLILDEPVSALDVSIQAQIVGLLERLQAELGLSYLFIAHDLAVVRHISTRVAVMYLGRTVEVGDCQEVFANPVHPYTQALLSAVPINDPVLRGRGQRILLAGDIPSPADPPSGCRFRTRCWRAQDRCTTEDPTLQLRGFAHLSACHFPSRSLDGPDHEQAA